MKTSSLGELVPDTVRFFLRGKFASLVAVTVLAALAPAARCTVVGIDGTGGYIMDVDPTSGIIANHIATPLRNAGIAFSPAGTLYALTGGLNASPSLNSLYSVDRATGTPTLIGSTGLAEVWEGDLAFSPDGTLYSISVGGPASNQVLQLVKIDTSTAAATVIGSFAAKSLSGGGPSAMAFTPSGTLYVLYYVNATAGDRLLTIDPATGVTLTSVQVSNDYPPISGRCGMYYDPSTGKLIAADASYVSLFSIDPTSGSKVAYVTRTRFGLTDITDDIFSVTTMPEPSLALVAVGTVGFVASIRRSARPLRHPA